jgi:hypothetical protein
VKNRKAAAEEVTRTLDQDLKEKKVLERVVRFSNKVFRQAAIEWLAATDQVWLNFISIFSIYLL